MLREVRRLAPRELDAEHVALDLRTPALRVGLHRGRNVSSDYGLLARASDILERPARMGLTLVLEGGARFDERGRHAWLAPGDLVLEDQSCLGTEAHGGARSRVIFLEWEPHTLGAPKKGAFELGRIGPADRARIVAIADALETTPTPAKVARLLAALRSLGIPFERLTAADLDGQGPADGDQGVLDVVADALSHLDALPAVEELGDSLGVAARTVHRRLGAIADEYACSWTHWRSALHLARMLTAIRLSAAPGATTERVARLSGFRSPVALCHAFALAGLPSPGVLARAASRGALGAWTDHLGPVAAE